MGSVLEAGSYEAVIEADDGDFETFSTVQLLKNGQLHQSWDPEESNPVISLTVNADVGDYYYIKVTQQDGDEAISSPISFTPSREGANKNPLNPAVLLILLFQ